MFLFLAMYLGFTSRLTGFDFAIRMLLVSQIFGSLLLAGCIKESVSNLGRGAPSKKLVGTASVLVFSLCILAFSYEGSGFLYSLSLSFVIVCISCLQPLNTIWYYLASGESSYRAGRLISLVSRNIILSIGLITQDLRYYFLANACYSLMEFVAFNSTLPSGNAPTRPRSSVSAMGVSYATNRVYQSTIKIVFQSSLGSLLPSLLVAEQIIGALNGGIEKYFSKITQAATYIDYAKLLLVGVLYGCLYLQGGGYSPTSTAHVFFMASINIITVTPALRAVRRNGSHFVGKLLIIAQILSGLVVLLIVTFYGVSDSIVIVYALNPIVVYLLLRIIR